MSQDDDKSPFDWDKWPFILPDGDPGEPEEDETSDSSFVRLDELSLRLSAEIGSVSAQSELGRKLLWGEDGYRKDPKEAVKWLGLAAEQGDAEAQADYGYCLQYGVGCKKDIKKAVLMLRAAAMQGDDDGMSYYGYCLQHGIGCKKNPRKGMRWYRTAAKQGYLSAQNNYAFCLAL